MTLVFTAVLLAAGMSGIGARQQTGSIFGLISDTNGEPLPGVRIVVLWQDRRVKEAITNSLGRYTIESVPPGTYRIEAHMAGFEPKVSAISVAARAVTDWSGAILIAPLVGEVPIEPRVRKYTDWQAVDCGRRSGSAEPYQLEKSLDCVVDSAKQHRPAAVIVQFTLRGPRGGYGLLTGSDGVMHQFTYGYARLEFQLQRCESPRVVPDKQRAAFVFACD